MSDPAADRKLLEIDEMIQEFLGWKELTTGARDAIEHKLAPLIAQVGSIEDVARAMTQDVNVLRAVCEQVLIHETSFFRHKLQFDWLTKDGLPRLYRVRRARSKTPCIRAWSCACSTGEEPFSVAMSLLDIFLPSEGWLVDVLATDVSCAVLRQATEAVWPQRVTASIPEYLLTRHFMQGKGGMQGFIRANSMLRSCVRFAEHRLGANETLHEGPFDLIFCRNVLIYFEKSRARQVIAELRQRLCIDGLLVFGENAIAWPTASLLTPSPSAFV